METAHKASAPFVKRGVIHVPVADEEIVFKFGEIWHMRLVRKAARVSDTGGKSAAFQLFLHAPAVDTLVACTTMRVARPNAASVGARWR